MLVLEVADARKQRCRSSVSHQTADIHDAHTSGVNILRICDKVEMLKRSA